MISKHVKNIAIGLICVYALGITVFVFTDAASSNEVIASVGSKKLYKQGVEDRIVNDYWDETLRTMTDELLIEQEIEALQLTVNQGELHDESEFVKMAQKYLYDLNDPKAVKYLTNRIYIKKLAEKYTINDEKLQKFLSEVDGDIGEATYEAVMLEGEHELLERVTESLANESVETVQKEMNVKFETVTLDENNAYGIELGDIHVGDIKHVHMESGNHALFKILKVNKKVVTSLEQQRIAVLGAYLNKKFYEEKVNVINHLRSKYLVALKPRNHI